MSITNEIVESLVSKAKEVKVNAYAPYSNFRVGVAVLTEDDSIFVGKIDNYCDHKSLYLQIRHKCRKCNLWAHFVCRKNCNQ